MSDASVSQRFTAAAKTYDEVADVQAEVAARVAAMLPPPDGMHRILDIGCGTGLLTRHLADRYPDATIHALDISPAMIDQAQANLSSPHLEWICADYTTYETTTPYDLICSSSALHWMTPLEQTFTRIPQSLHPDGIFAAALMLHDTFKELHDLRDGLFPLKPIEQRLPTESDIRHLLPASFRLETTHMTSPVASPKAFFSAIHRLGVTGGAVSRTRLAPSEVAQLVAAFDATEVTWQVGYISNR